MYNLKPTFKSALSILVKIIVLLGAGYFIYSRLFESNHLNSGFNFTDLKMRFVKNKILFLLAISLSIFNWFLEILKWHILVNTQQKITFVAASKQSLSALTASMITPNRVGDYLAKSLYFDKKKTIKIIALNFIGHGFQLGTTILFGVIGLVYLSLNYPVKLSVNFKVVAFLSILFFIFLSFKKGRVWLKKIMDFYRNQPSNLFTKIGFLSVLRYLIFSHQFYLLSIISGLEIAYFPTMMAIFSMYLLASIWPSLSLTDWLVKGSAAIFVFGFLGVAPLLVMQVSLLMWICNFALPAVAGGYFVIRFKPAKS